MGKQPMPYGRSKVRSTSPSTFVCTALIVSFSL